MRRALGLSLCILALGCASTKALVRSVPGGGYLCDTTGLSYAFCEGSPDFTVVDGYAVLRSDLELFGAIVGLENGTVVPVREGDGMQLVGPIGYSSGDADDILKRADKNRDFAVNTEELNQILYRVLKRLYPDVLQ
ncbi:hypothetical protein HOC80_05085 [archaeon]|nr:hypothetical protein [archaeon]